MVQMQPSSSLIGIGSLNNTSEVGHLSTEMHSQEEEHQHFQHHQQQQYDNQAAQQQQQQQQHPQPNIDDFIEQMFLMPWEMNAQQQNTNNQKLYTMSLLPQQQQQQGGENLGYAYDESALLAARLRQHHINSNLNVALNPHANNSDSSLSPGRSMVLQLSTGNTNPSQLLSVMGNSPRNHAASPPQLPLSLGQGKPVDMNESRAREEIMANNAREASMGALFPAFPGSATRGLRPQGPSFHQQQIHQMQGYGGMPLPQHGVPPPSSGVGAPPARPRVRARRGQATDPHSIAERLRRERIAERMKALQELVPNSNKTDKASMLDEIIDYVKFLQLQVKVLSMSRLGGAGAVAPLVADMPSEGSNGQGKSNGAQQNTTSSDGMALTERQVAKLMEEDMGSAMQYLQGKGLCLMPISLATAISSSNKSQASQQQQHQSPLQGLFASVHHAGIPEPANSSLSAITSLSSPTDTDNGKQHATNGMRTIPKDGNPSKANGIIGAGPHLLNNANKADEESQSRRTCQ